MHPFGKYADPSLNHDDYYTFYSNAANHGNVNNEQKQCFVFLNYTSETEGCKMRKTHYTIRILHTERI